eukprot:scaffold325602_cov23-Prasinocladus_malaysianus.AAC.1
MPFLTKFAELWQQLLWYKLDDKSASESTIRIEPMAFSSGGVAMVLGVGSKQPQQLDALCMHAKR